MLAQIDPRPFQAQLAQARAAKARNEALLANAKLDLERTTMLATREYATRQSLDTQRALPRAFLPPMLKSDGRVWTARSGILPSSPAQYERSSAWMEAPSDGEAAMSPYATDTPITPGWATGDSIQRSVARAQPSESLDARAEPAALHRQSPSVSVLTPLPNTEYLSCQGVSAITP